MTLNFTWRFESSVPLQIKHLRQESMRWVLGITIPLSGAELREARSQGRNHRLCQLVQDFQTVHTLSPSSSTLAILTHKCWHLSPCFRLTRVNCLYPRGHLPHPQQVPLIKTALFSWAQMQHQSPPLTINPPRRNSAVSPDLPRPIHLQNGGSMGPLREL